MTFEQRSTGAPAEPAPIAAPQTGAAGGPTPIQIRLQILSTEHWSLLASRGLAWNESFSRAGMYLSIIAATPFLITVLNAVVIGAIVAIVALRIGTDTVVVLGVTVVAFVIAMVVQARFARGNVQQIRGLMRPMFPTPSTGDRPVE
jgi:hypothetical protein